MSDSTRTPVSDAAGTAETGGIEDIYPLTPLQSGMLYHSLRAEQPGAYTEQFVFVCTAEPSARLPRADDLGAAWQAVVRRHPVLRTGFVWEEVDTPVQVVASSCALPVEERDLTGLGSEEAQAGVEEFLAADRARGIDVAKPPLMRLALLHARDRTFLVWTVHHLVIDGWSMPKILDEVGAVHRAGTAAAALPEVRPFRHYVDWLEGQDDAAAARFWKDRLGTLPPAERLHLRPGDERERRGRAAAGSAEHELSAPLTATVRAAARAAQVSLSTWFQAAWAVALSHTGPGPQVFGVTVASRPAQLPGAEGIVGPCVNTVVQRLDAVDGGALRDWLRHIQHGQTAALPHQHLGLPEVRRMCGGDGEAPLFESIVAFENYPDQGTFLDLGPGTSVELWKYVEDTAYPLTFVVLPGESAIGLRLFYDPRRFGAEAIRTVLGRVEAAVTAMTADLGRPVSAVRAAAARPSLARGAARDRTAGGPSALAGMTLHHIVGEQAARTPDAPAVDDHGQVTTYAELDARATVLARRLRGLGVGRDTVVALLLRRGTRALVSILGVLKAGAAYLALDPAHPDERLEFLLADSGAAALVTEEGTHDRLPGAGPPRLRADTGGTGADAADGTPPLPPSAGSGSGPDDLCYVTYTSGSTGRPKGVAMQHGVVAGMLAWELARGSVPAPARTLAQVSFTFDVSAQEVFTAWGSGGTLVLADDDDRVDFERLVALARDREVQRWYMSPTALGQVARAAERTGTRLPRLREIMTAGEPLEVDDTVRRLLTGPEAPVRLENQYGSSECQVVSSLRLTGDARTFPRRPGIGSPVDGVDLYVLDEAWRPVAVGVPGMICVGGDAVPRGYLGRPGATAERLLPDPFARRPGRRMYVTGDLGVLHPDGTLECLGRADDQAKIRGHRVEPGEVRAALRGLPGVRDAAVVVRDTAGERRLVGYVVPAGGPWPGDGTDEEARLRSALREKLPAPFVPWRIVQLTALPVTTSGKVDRGALPVPEPPRRDTVAEDPGERPALAAMLRLWADVLPAGRVEPDADFLALGGDSLLAIRLTGRVRKTFSVGLGVSRLMKVRTPLALLAEVDAELGGPAVSDRAAHACLPADVPVPTGERS